MTNDPPTLPGDSAEATDIAPLEELTPAMLMRCADVEDRLARAWSRGQVEHWLAEAYGIKARQARRIYAMAAERWSRESSDAGREGRIAQLEAIVMTGMRAALERRGLALDKEGGEHWYPNPDIGGLGRLLEFKARLRGDLAQPNGTTLIGFGDEALKAIAQIYGSGQAPGLPPEIEATVVEMPMADSDEQP